MAKKKQIIIEENNKVVTNCDNLRSLMFNPILPYAFTEPGIALLSSVLHNKKQDFLTDLEKDNKQYAEVQLVEIPLMIHDRY